MDSDRILTLEEAEAEGLVDPDPWAVYRNQYRIVVHENPYSPHPMEFAPSWTEWRFYKMAVYFGYPPIVRRVEPQATRSGVVDVSHDPDVWRAMMKGNQHD